VTRVFVPRDASAISVGAEEVASAIEREAFARGVEVEVVRNGSRGLFWLEPLVEVETTRGRVAYGPVDETMVASLFEAGFLEGAPHAAARGPTEQIPYLQRQERLTFARCGVIDPLSLDAYRAHGGYAGLEQALALGGAGIVDVVAKSGLRGRGGAGFPTGIKWKTVCDTPADQKYIVDRRSSGWT
jgi:formate dehydrogenase iron-sulfur subunit